MINRQSFSHVTEDYLRRFYEILDEMIAGMTSPELTNSLSHNFIVQMIPHHRAAIEMSRNLLQFTTCIPLQEIASGIITEQTKSIENMQAVLSQCGKLQNAQRDICLYQRGFQQITQRMFRKMQEACATNSINQDFMREMIPHHEGAIQMSKNLLQFKICRELLPIVQAIITSQQEGVRKMQCLLRCS